MLFSAFGRFECFSRSAVRIDYNEGVRSSHNLGGERQLMGRDAVADLFRSGGPRFNHAALAGFDGMEALSGVDVAVEDDDAFWKGVETKAASIILIDKV